MCSTPASTARRIGVSNFCEGHLVDLLAVCRTPPFLNQVARDPPKTAKLCRHFSLISRSLLLLISLQTSPHMSLLCVSHLMGHVQETFDVEPRFDASVGAGARGNHDLVPLQIEVHPLCYPRELIALCRSRHVAVQAYSSLGSPQVHSPPLVLCISPRHCDVEVCLSLSKASACRLAAPTVELSNTAP